MNSMPFQNVTAELAALDAKINSLLPARYQHCYTSVPPDSMGSAELKYGPDGKVEWDQIWTTFCDLALAGGPPHRGSLLEPVSEAAVAADPKRYESVVAEIVRAIRLATCARPVKGYAPGWVGVQCDTAAEAAWLQMAITAENVSVRRRETILQLPAGPNFRVEKEIKNIVVALAKTSHYWDGHLTADQQSLAGDDICEAAAPAEVAADPSHYAGARDIIEEALAVSGLAILPHRYAGWVGVETAADEDAVWLLRAILVERVLARREERVLYLPVGADRSAEHAARVAQAFVRAWRLFQAASSRRTAWRPSSRR
jgi:hypothetical protein